MMTLPRILIYGFIFFLSLPMASAGEIRGSVLDEQGEPVAGAVVRIQATENSVLTDAGGRFLLENTLSGESIVTAWKEGHLNGRSKPAHGPKERVIVLKPVPLGDNLQYRWISPGHPTFLERADIILRKGIVAATGKEELASRFARNCSNCHADSIVPQWRADAHSRSAGNPILLSMYNGTDTQGKNGVFPGYKLDFPKSEGNCASCHAPVHALTSGGGGDLNRVNGIAREGIFCDFCHKVKEVALHSNGGYPGVLSMKFNRPPKGKQVFYGPYDDAVAGPDTFGAVYKESRFCASCHNAAFWGIPIYSEFEEWSKSAYAKEGTQCQDCHMAQNGKATHAAPPEKGGVKRDPSTVSTHTFRGPADLLFMSDAIRLDLTGSKKEGAVEVRIDLSNVGAGHHIPTGVPMRNLILLVEATDAKGNRLKQLEGPVVPEWGGTGNPEKGNYAGLPGKGFAKILADAAKNFPRANPDHRSPTPHWRQSVIVSDNRIPAKGTDASQYRFQTARGTGEKIKVTARLIYRRSFKPWIDAKGWPLADLEIARKETTVSRQIGPRNQKEGR